MLNKMKNNHGFLLLETLIAMFLATGVVVGIMKAGDATNNIKTYFTNATLKSNMLLARDFLIQNAIVVSGSGGNHYDLLAPQGGTLPSAVSVNPNDQYGTQYIYCSWDLSKGNANAAYSTNISTPPKPDGIHYIIGRIISAGPDKAFATGCNDTQANSDDVVIDIYENIVDSANGGLGGWKDNLTGGYVSLMNPASMVSIGGTTPPNHQVELPGGTTPAQGIAMGNVELFQSASGTLTANVAGGMILNGAGGINLVNGGGIQVAGVQVIDGAQNVTAQGLNAIGNSVLGTGASNTVTAHGIVTLADSSATAPLYLGATPIYQTSAGAVTVGGTVTATGINTTGNNVLGSTSINTTQIHGTLTLLDSSVTAPLKVGTVAVYNSGPSSLTIAGTLSTTGGYAVGATNVIDASRNLVGVNSIGQDLIPGASGVYSLGSAGAQFLNVYGGNIAGGTILQNGNKVIDASTLNGTTNFLAKFTGANSVGNSQIADDGTNVAINSAPQAGNKLYVKGATADGTTNALAVVNSAGASMMTVKDNGNILVGTTTDNGNKLQINGNVTVSGNITGATWQAGIVAPLYGGTGLDGSAAANGKLLIGNGAGYTLATMTQGATNGVTITNGAGTITLDTVQDIRTTATPQFAGLKITANGTLAWAPTAARTITLPDVTGMVITTGNLTGITSTGTISAGTWNGSIIGTTYGGTGLDGHLAANGTLLIGNGSGYSLATLTQGATAGVTITNTAGGITLDTAQDIRTSATPQFSGLKLTANGLLTWAPTASRSIALPDVTGMVITTGNMNNITGVGTITAGTWNGSTIGVQYGGTGATTLTGLLKGNGTSALTAMTGTSNYLTKWTDAAGTVGNSLVYDNGTHVMINSTTDDGVNMLQVNGATKVTGNLQATGNVAFGGNPQSQYTLYVQKALTGNTLSVGVVSSGQIQSDVTNSGQYFRSVASTAAASFSTSIQHYTAAQSTLGVGSTVPLQSGFVAESTLVGGTSNYGFWGQLPSAANNYNLYMSGAAKNYLAGNLLLGTTTDDGVSKLQVNGNAAITGNITSGTWQGGIIAPLYGGTGVNGSVAANGKLLIGNGAGYTLANLTQGATNGVTITNSAGGIALDTAQDIRTTATPTFAGLKITANGTLAWAPTAGRIITMPDVTGTVITTGNLSGITSTGTITSGTWNGSTIGVQYGGTGAATLTGLLKGNGTSALTAMTGTSNYLTKWTDAAGTVGNSTVYDNGTNVLIGTTTDNGIDKFQVVGSGIFSSSVKTGSLSGLYTVTNGNQMSAYNNGANSALYLQYSSTGDTIINQLGGNVLIGTGTDSGARLNIVSAAAGVQAQFTDAVNGTISISTPTSGVGLIMGSTGGTNLALGAGGSEKMRIGINGDVLIGTTSDDGTDKLQVNGTTLLNGMVTVNQTIHSATVGGRLLLTGSIDGAAATGGGTIALRENTAATNPSGVDIWTGAAQRMTINSAGNVLINKTTSSANGDATTSMFQVNGTINATGYYLNGVAASFPGAGTVTGQTLYWTGSVWAPNSGLIVTGVASGLFNADGQHGATDYRIGVWDGNTAHAGIRMISNGTGFATIDSFLFNASGTVTMPQNLVLNPNGGDLLIGSTGDAPGGGHLQVSTPSVASLQPAASFINPNTGSGTGAQILIGPYAPGYMASISSTGNPGGTYASNLWLQPRITGGTLGNGILMTTADNVLIGSSTDNGNKFQVTGNIWTSGNMYWGTKGVWMDSWLNQAVLTSSAPSFAGLTITGGSNFYSGANYFYSNKGSGSYSGSQNTTPGLMAFSSDGGTAYMSFHRNGLFAVNMGLDSDNVLRIGGWSAAANLFQMDMSGNLTMAGTITGTKVYNAVYN